MNAKHLIVGGGAASVIVAVVAVLTRHRVHLTESEAIWLGSTALSVGAGLAARIEKVGLKGLFRGLWSGQKASQEAV